MDGGSLGWGVGWHFHSVEPEIAGGLAGLTPAEEVERGIAEFGIFHGVVGAELEIGEVILIEQQDGMYGADQSRLGAAAVAEGERDVPGDVPHDDLGHGALVGVVVAL